MTKDEALKLALEALEEIALAGMSPAPEMIDSKEAFHAQQAWRFIGVAARALDPIKEALAQPEPEPQYAGTARELFTNAAIERLDVRPSTKVYLGTPSVCEQPAHQEPVLDASAPMVVHPHPAFQATPPQPEPVIDKSAAIRIATALGWEPKRTWVGLTDEEIDAILKRGDVAEHDAWNGRWYVLPYSFAKAIEAKLKEKNT